MAKKEVCNHNCFCCTHDDCIVSDKSISSAERAEIRERDNRYFNSIDAKPIIRQKYKRARQKYSR